MTVHTTKVFHEILVIAEEPEWKIGKVTPQVNLDPLIVGWVEQTGQLFLIDSYNMTSLEKYVEDQFAYGVTTTSNK